ncbi:MAG: endonuclease III, partial [Yaniella sp.]|nr:endonuclease III [Yaniella sp.]
MIVTDETPLAKKRRARKIYRVLGETFPYAHAELDFSNPFELLVATVLSAQTTDIRVNSVTPTLFERYPDAHAMAQAQETDLQDLVRSTGFYKNKARALLG